MKYDRQQPREIWYQFKAEVARYVGYLHLLLLGAWLTALRWVNDLEARLVEDLPIPATSLGLTSMQA